MNQVVLAERTGIRQVRIKDYELGLRKPPLNELRKLASALGIEAQELFG